MKHVIISDLEDLALGAAILRSGGGGNPTYDLMMAKQHTEEYGHALLVDVKDLSDDALVAPIAFMGAPLVGVERLPSGEEFVTIITEIEKALGRAVTHLMPAEVGGANAFTPFMVAGRLGLPVLDADTLGRAFPELQMSSCHLLGISPSPAFLCDCYGKCVPLFVKDAYELEKECRHIAVEMGSSAAICCYLMTGKEAKVSTVTQSLQQAMALGKVIRKAQKKGDNPLKALCQAAKGKILCEGMITDIDQFIEEGFLKGSFTVQQNNTAFRIDYQNEFLAVYRNGIPIASTPDIIIPLEQETATPITSETLAYGLRVAMYGFPKPISLELCKRAFSRWSRGVWLSNRLSKGEGAMLKKYTIGIDIGGTHTDAVLIDDQQKIVSAYKTLTTSPLEEGVKTALKEVLNNTSVDKKAVSGIFVGTTHATNAIVEAKNLSRVGLIRIAGQHPKSLHPCFGWPEKLLHNVLASHVTVDGGYECDMRVMKELDKNQVATTTARLLENGAESIAIVGVFSPLRGTHEQECANIVREVAGTPFPISLSHEIGGIGFIERENATILNVSLKKAMEEGFHRLERIRDKLGLACPLYMTQNDGSLMNISQAIHYPILTISSGPTNSFIGAAKLTERQDAVIVDVGGTSTDVGIVLNGYPRRSIHNTSIGGVSLNFRMPDVLALSLGGGTLVEVKSHNTFQIGPESCGKKLVQYAQAFGGNLLTMTDVGCLVGCFNISEASNDFSISQALAQQIFDHSSKMIANGISLMKGNKKNLPVIVVGGGAGLASPIATEIPHHASVANAYGAALAEVSATVDTVVSLKNREEMLGALKEKALKNAIAKGAKENKTRIVDVQIIPYHYVPNQMARVIVIASGQQGHAALKTIF